MYSFVKNCYCIWIFALGGCSLEEESEHRSLLLNTSDFYLGLSILFCVILCKFSFSVKYTTSTNHCRISMSGKLVKLLNFDPNNILNLLNPMTILSCVNIFESLTRDEPSRSLTKSTTLKDKILVLSSKMSHPTTPTNFNFIWSVIGW